MYARSLSRLALVFSALYVLLVISAVFPVRLLDYDWINRVTATLINGSSMPLLAILVLVVGTLHYPENNLLKERRLIFARFAGLAALGFLLLIPVNIYTGLLQQTGTSDQVRALDAAERQLNSYRRATNQATSAADLQIRLSKLSAPAINPDVLALPLAQVKAQMAAGFNQVAAQIAEQRQALSAQSGWAARGPEVLRVVVASLFLSFGFAAFAQPTPTGRLLLDRLEEKLAHVRRQSRLRKASPSGSSAGDSLKQPSWFQKLLAGRPPGPRKRKLQLPLWFRKVLAGRSPQSVNFATPKPRRRKQGNRDYIKSILSEDSKKS